MKQKHVYLFLISMSLLLFLFISKVEAATGTILDPYLIYDCTELQNIKNNLTASYALAKSIDCSDTVSWDNGQGFLPIGTTAAPFTGSLNGRGYVISGLMIKRMTMDNVGMFANAIGPSSFKNINLQNVNITGNGFVGSLIGYADVNVDAANILVSGTVSGHDGIGGIFGRFRGNMLRNAHFKGNITGDESVGGIAGLIRFATVSYSSFQGDMKGYDRIGGIAGQLTSPVTLEKVYVTGTLANDAVNSFGRFGGLVGNASQVTVRDSYSYASVTCGGNCTNGEIGGAFGYIDNSAISNVYSAGLVTTTHTKKGGFIGNGVSNTITSSYWDSEASELTTSAGGVSKTTVQMKTKTTFTGWDFVDIWSIDGLKNDGYPFLLPPDLFPPGDVKNLTSSETTNTITLFWQNPNDSDFDTVNIYRDGVKVGSSKTGSFIDSGLQNATMYRYTVKAVDKSGNESNGVRLDVTTKGGSFLITAPSMESFANVVVNGFKQIIKTSFTTSIQIADNTGTGNGWNVTVAATPFKEVGGKGYTLPSQSLVMQRPNNILVKSGDAVKLPTIQSGGPWVIDGGNAVKIVSANAGYGMGSYEIGFPNNALELTIKPETTYIDSIDYPLGTPYTSTITFTVVSGP